MRVNRYFILACLLATVMGPHFSAAQNQDAAVFKLIVQRYYKNEKPVYKNRSQLLYLYCERANNNEELVEALQGNTEVPAAFKQEIRGKIQDVTPMDWRSELEAIPEKEPSRLRQKIHECLDLAQYQEVSQRLNLNNQRLMILSKPLYYSKGSLALVKVTFYRNIEHNSGTVLLLEQKNGIWTIKDYLNSWST